MALGEGRSEEEDLSPSESLIAWMRSAAVRFRRDRGEASTGIAPVPFWRELVVTVALLILWRVVATGVPLPFVEWSVAKEFTQQLGWPWGKLSVGALDLDAYLLAHAVMFWVVMAFSKLRHMEFRYRFSLNLHVLGLTLVFALPQAWYHLNWLRGTVSPTSQGMAVSPYFAGHPLSYLVVGFASLLAGLAFSLAILQLIGRFGIPCPLTCMLICTGLFNFETLHVPWTIIKALSLNQQGPHPQMATAAKMAIVFVFLVLFIALIAGIVASRRRGKAHGAMGPPSFGLRWPGEPQPHLYGTFLTHVVLTAPFLACQAVIIGMVLAGGRGLEMVSGWMGWFLRGEFVYLKMASAAVLSLCLFHRLVYNPALRHRLGAKLGLAESLVDMQGEARRALAAWCGFCVLMVAARWLKYALMGQPLVMQLFGYVELWDIAILVLTLVMLRDFYRLRREGISKPVMAHSYYEPLFAARALLGQQGIRSQIWGEPVAVLTGYIVGPAGMKRLLVAEADRARAVELLAPTLR